MEEKKIKYNIVYRFRCRQCKHILLRCISVNISSNFAIWNVVCKSVPIDVSLWRKKHNIRDRNWISSYIQRIYEKKNLQINDSNITWNVIYKGRKMNHFISRLEHKNLFLFFQTLQNVSLSSFVGIFCFVSIDEVVTIELWKW